MLKKILVALCIAGASLAAVFAAENSMVPAMAPGAATSVNPEAVRVVQAAIGKLSADKLRIDSIETSPLPGFYQVIASGRLVYVSTDGKYLLDGDLIGLAQRNNLSEQAWARFRKAELAKVPADGSIVYTPAKPRYTVTVFTDVNCAYCRALHEHIAEYNRDGIAVRYMAWPREGITTTAGNPTPTYKEMASVWCAADRKASFDAATQDHAPKSASCVNPVKDQFELGVRLGVNGTPAIYGPDGRMLGGYLTPKQLLDALQGG